MVVHHALYGVGLLGAVELFLVGLLPLDHGHGQDVFQEVGVDVQHLLGLCPGLLGGGVHGVALLPQEFPVAEEGAGGLLPPEDGAPLVVQLGQVPVGLDDVFIVLAEQGLGRGPDAVALLQGIAAAVGHPGALGGEALHMVLLLLQQGLGDEEGEVDVLVACLLKALVQFGLDVFPDGVAIGAVDEHALDGGESMSSAFLHIGVPLGEVHLHVGDLLDFLLVVLSHSSHPLTQRAGLGPAGIYRGSKFSVRIYCRTLGGKCQVSCGPLFHPRQGKERAGALSLTGEGGKRVIPPPSGRNA